MKEEEVLSELWEVICDRLARPREGSYVSRITGGEKGIDGVLEKVGEEAVEFVLAVKGGSRERIVSEAADLQFHLLVALAASGNSFDEVLAELARRRR
jgi:phosphoribosyl-ATP pyrophosphohydrolase